MAFISHPLAESRYSERSEESTAAIVAPPTEKGILRCGRDDHSF
jgi:hypothetical protein